MIIDECIPEISGRKGPHFLSRLHPLRPLALATTSSSSGSLRHCRSCKSNVLDNSRLRFSTRCSTSLANIPLCKSMQHEQNDRGDTVHQNSHLSPFVAYHRLALHDGQIFVSSPRFLDHIRPEVVHIPVCRGRVIFHRVMIRKRNTFRCIVSYFCLKRQLL